MDPLTTQVLLTGAVELLMIPVLVFVLKRIVGKRLDQFDEKREIARVEQEAENERKRNTDKAMERGMRSLLRSELIHEHRKWMGRGYCPLESKEYVQKTYEAYHGLGGNDIGTAMYNDIMALPTKEEA